VPTRSGVPLLFPFPNRIRGGRFRANGKEYQLPLNDSTKQNAIHGFAPRRPWRVTGHGADDTGAWLRGEFRASLDAPDTLGLWPSDYSLTADLRLGALHLRYDFDVANLGSEPLPFGLGMHPYFRFPYCGPDENVARWRLHAPAKSVWLLEDSLPTGQKWPAQGELNWNELRAIGDAAPDTVYTDLGEVHAASGGLLGRAELRHTDFGGALSVWCSPEFRESVLFTPVHRKAVCVEPYTCATDAANLAERGVDAGWRVLAPGARWKGAVEFRWDPYATELLKIP